MTLVWWIVWTVLVLAALAVLVTLALRLWGKVKLLGQEAKQASASLERLERAADDLPEPPPPPLPGVLRDPATLGAARATRIRIAVERDDARAARRSRAVARWRALRLLG